MCLSRESQDRVHLCASTVKNRITVANTRFTETTSRFRFRGLRWKCILPLPGDYITVTAALCSH